MQYLEQSAAMATIKLNIIPDEMAQPIQVAGLNPQGTARNAIQALVHVLQFLANAAIVIILLVIPVLIAISIPIAGLIFVVRSFVRWRRARKMRQAAK
jgi:Flp pilus assembly protein TadB